MMKSVVSIVFVAMLLPSLAISQDCIEYADYLHRVGDWNTPGGAHDVVERDGLLYVADGPSGLTILDPQGGDGPEIIGGTVTEGSAGYVVLGGDHAYIADGSGGLQIVDVSDPAAPYVAGSAPTPG